MTTKREILEGIKSMIRDFGTRDPRRDCWGYVIKHHPSLWRDHQAALREIDAGFQAKDAGRVITAKGIALDTFNRMIEAWEHRSDTSQPDLLAA